MEAPMALPARAWLDVDGPQDIQYVAALWWSGRDGVRTGGVDRRPCGRNEGLATSHLRGRRSGWRGPNNALEQRHGEGGCYFESVFFCSSCPRAVGAGCWARVSLCFADLRSLAAAWRWPSEGSECLAAGPRCRWSERKGDAHLWDRWGRGSLAEEGSKPQQTWRARRSFVR